jgi:hypothetical protein
MGHETVEAHAGRHVSPPGRERDEAYPDDGQRTGGVACEFVGPNYDRGPVAFLKWGLDEERPSTSGEFISVIMTA